MKLIRIGNSPKCDLRLDSDYVSALHAEMTILDDGQIILEDKNSRNGTTVGNKRIEPGKEISVQRGDLITFADTQLAWARIPAAEKLTNYSAIYNVGTNYRNDIILNSQTVSRYHASVRIGKDKKVYIHDNGSRNGTMVNGTKITPNKDVRIKKGDNIVVGAEDITDQVTSLIPPNNILKILAIAGAIAAVFLCVAIFWPNINHHNDDNTPETIDPAQLRPAVVYVYASWHPVVQFDPNPMPGTFSGELHISSLTYNSEASAFFLDSLGRMGTNHHVAEPWIQLSKQETNEINDFIESQLPKNGESTEAYIKRKTIFYKYIVEYIHSKASASLEDIESCVSRLGKAKLTVKGEIDRMGIGYPGRFYKYVDEFQPCNVLTVSNDENIDLAILQLNSKVTPKDIKRIFSADNFFDGILEPLKDELYNIGYPQGIGWAQDEKTKSLEPGIRETKCSKEPGKYSFDFQASSTHGSSGSPVFNKYGELVGVLWGGYHDSASPTFAVHAKFLKRMYDEEVNM